MTDRSIRDIVAVQLWRYRGVGPINWWGDVPNAEQEDWRNDADRFIARLESAGVRLVKEE